MALQGPTWPSDQDDQTHPAGPAAKALSGAPAAKALGAKSITPAPQTPPKPVDNSMDVAALGKEGAAVHEETARGIGGLEADRMKLTPPELRKPEKFEAKTDPISDWARVAIVFAALGGHGSRQALTASLNAAAAGVKGLREGNKEEAERQYKVWERETENAQRLIQFQNDAYKTALGDVLSREAAVKAQGTEREAAVNAKMNAVAIAQQDPVMAQAKTLPEKVAIYQKRKDYSEKMEERKLEFSSGASKFFAHQATEQEQNAWLQTDEGRAASPLEVASHKNALMMQHGLEGKSTGAGFGVGSTYAVDTPVKQEQQMERWAALIDPPFDASKRAMNMVPGLAETWGRFIERAKAEGHPYDPEAYKEAKDATKALSPGGKDGQKLETLSTVEQHTRVMEEAVKALNATSDVNVVNRITQWVSGKITGDPSITDVNFVKKIYVQELAKAVAANSSTTGAERDALEASTAAELSQRQWFGDADHPGIFGRAHELLNGKYAGLKQAYTDKIPEVTLKRHFTPEMDAFFEAEVKSGATDKAQGGAPSAQKKGGAATHEARYVRNGKEVPVKFIGGKWVFEDGSPVPGQ